MAQGTEKRRLRAVNGSRGEHSTYMLLEPVTVVCGANESGKTTLIDLIVYGIDGLTRERRPTEWLVDLDFGDLHIHRRVERPPGEDAAHSVAVRLPGLPAFTKARDAQTAIAREIGNAWSWDVRGVLDSTPAERRKAIAKVLGTSLTVRQVRDALAEEDAGYRAMPPEGHEYVRGAVEAALKLPDDAGAEFAAAWLQALRDAKNQIQAAVEASRAAVATAEQRVAAAGAMPGATDAYTAKVAELRAAATECERQLAACAAHDADRATLQAALNDAEKALIEGRLKADATPARQKELLDHAKAGVKAAEEAAAKTAEACTAALANVQSTIRGERVSEEIERLATAYATVEQRYVDQWAASEVDVDTSAQDAAEAAFAAAIAAKTASQTAHEAAKATLASAKDALTVAEAGVRVATKDAGDVGAAHALRELLEPVLSFVADYRPASKNRDDAESASRFLQKLLDTTDDARTEAWEKARGAFNTAEISVKMATQSLDERFADLRQADADAFAADLERQNQIRAVAKVRAARDAALAALPAIAAERDAAVAALCNAALAHPTDLPTVEEAAAARKASHALADAAQRQEARAREVHAEQVANLNARKIVEERAQGVYDVAVRDQERAQYDLGSLIAAQETTSARLNAIGGDTAGPHRAQLETITAEIEQYDALLKQIEAYNAITADRDRCVQKAGAYAAHRTGLHETEKRAEAVVARLYQEAVRPLVEPASEITTAVLGRPLTILPADGWSVGIDGVPVEHCSESVAMICGLALHAATQRQISGWKALLVDGAEVIEAGRRTALVRALGEFGLDNVILTSVDDGWRAAPGVAVRQLVRSAP